MEAVSIRTREILRMAVGEGVQPACGVEVYHRYRPYVARLLDCLDIAVYPQSYAVWVELVGLDIRRAGAEVCPVDRCQQDDLFCREHILYHLHRLVYASAECRVVDAESAVLAALCHLLPVLGVDDIPLLYVVPFAEWHGVDIIVCAHEDDDGIDILPVLCREGLHLAWYVVPLPSAYGVAVACGLEPLAQHGPPFLCPCLHAWVSYRVAEVCYALSLPWVCVGWLCCRCE